LTNELEQKPFGQTGEKVSIVGLGGGALAKYSFESGVATVQRALELGITYFDTSPLYGSGLSQAIMGTALEGKKENFLLATKIGHFRHHSLFRSKDAVQAQIGENLRLLKRNQVDILQIHESDWVYWWADQPPHESLIDIGMEYDFLNAPVMNVLQEAKKKGLCRYIGITGNNATETAHVLKHVSVDTYLLAFNYDLIWRIARAEAMPLAQVKTTAFITAALFQSGRLIEVHPEWLDAPPTWMTREVYTRFKGLYTLQRECGLTLIEMGIRFLLADPGINLILLGAAAPEEIEECIIAAQEGPLPVDLQGALEELGVPG